MPYLSIDFQLTLPNTLATLISAIIEQIPGSKVVAEDWFAQRRAEEERTTEYLRQKGNPVRFADEILRSVDRAREAAGPTKCVSIPVDEKTTMKGRISNELILLHTDVVLEPNAADHLLKIIMNIGIIKDVTISNLPAVKNRFADE